MTRSAEVRCLLSLLLLSCSAGSRSQVMVVVDGEDRVRAMSERLEVVVRAGEQLEDVVFSLTSSRSEGIAWGTTVAVAPRARDASRRFRVDATAYDASGVVATTYAISGFVEGEVRELRLLLRNACIGARCDEDRACREGGECVEPFIPPDLLPPFVREDAGRDDADPGTDAGQDAGTTDAGTDAGRDGGSDAGDGGPTPECIVNGDCPAADCAGVDCIAGECVYEPRHSACDPGNPCLRGVCDPLDGCREETVGGPCDDGTFCNGADNCEAGVCNPSGVSPCGMGTCNEDADVCGCARPADCTHGRDCVLGECVCPGGGTENACGNGADDDCDGLTDCADPNCAGRSCDGSGRTCMGGMCECASDVEFCRNGVDDDCDGLADCADPDCGGAICGDLGERCSGSTCACPGSIESCTNGIDDTCDGLADCADPNCRNMACGPMGLRCQSGSCRCPAETETCGNMADDDCDGATDEGCSPEMEDCTNGVDDDGDGAIDCEDFPDCLNGSPCALDGTCQRGACCVPVGPEVCPNGVDDDCDGSVDNCAE